MAQLRAAPLSILLAALAAIASAAAPPLRPLAYAPLPAGAVLPASWLQRELRLQGDGLGGELRRFWPGFTNSMWLGGNDTEWDFMDMYPYVLNGFVGQAILLGDAAQLADAAAYVDGVLEVQRGQGGWLGPDRAGNAPGKVYFPRWPVIGALLQWAEFTGNASIAAACVAWTHVAAGRVAARTPPIQYDWTGVRMQGDWLWLNHWLVDLADPERDGGALVNATEVDFLLNFSSALLTIARGIVDFERDWFVDPADGGFFPTEAVPSAQANLTNHGVNLAMQSKGAASLARLVPGPGGADSGRASSLRRLALLDQYHGQPTGAFSADEHLAGRGANRGVETCTVVEWMLSLAVMHETHGDASFAERAERLAYNALPASLTKDFWARVYLVQPNEPAAVAQTDPPWATDGSDASLFSLEANWGCCTANFVQGWPKFIQRLVHATPGGGAAVSMYAPATARLAGGFALEVAGDYPFDDVVSVTVTAPGGGGGGGGSGVGGGGGGGRGAATPSAASFPLTLRIPSWASAATLSVNGAPDFSVGAFAGSMYDFALPLLPASSSAGVARLSFKPALRLEPEENGAVSVHRGALLYALQLDEQFAVLREWQDPRAKDYNVSMAASSAPWNVALVLADPSAPDSSLSFGLAAPGVPEVPFSSQDLRNVISGVARVVNAWRPPAADGAAASAPPPSPVDCAAPGACGAPFAVRLVPIGATHIRMSVLPWTTA
jgi:hypothetical protein